MEKLLRLMLVVPILSAACRQNLISGSNESPQSEYQSDWTSLRVHQTPQWLIDAKFGIYCHWGIQTLSYSVCENILARGFSAC